MPRQPAAPCPPRRSRDMDGLVNLAILKNPLNWLIVLAVAALTMMMLRELDRVFQVGKTTSASASSKLQSQLPV